MSKQIERLEDLKPDPRNANRGTPRGHAIIENSVRHRGAGRSGLAAADGTMIAGSQTLHKMAELGIPVRTIHTTGEEWVVVVRDDIEPGSEAATLLALEDNRATEVGLDWEPDILAGIAESGLDLSSLFTADEWAEVSMPAAGEPEDDQPVSVDETKPTRCQLGETWRIGRHKISCSDSTDRANVERLLDAAPDMVWADAPYGLDIVTADGFVGGGEKYDIPFGGVKNRGAAKGLITANGSFGSAPVLGGIGATSRRADPKRMTQIVSPGRVIKAGRYAPVAGDENAYTARTSALLLLELYPDAMHIWWGANHFSDVFPPSPCWLVWDKENTGYFADAELAWCSDDSAVRIFKHMWNGMLRESEHGARIHPTQKPIALCGWAFEKYGSAGDLIFDPFLGSGPSLKAAESMDRTVIGFELSPHYCDHLLGWGEAHRLEVSRVDD